MILRFCPGRILLMAMFFVALPVHADWFKDDVLSMPARPTGGSVVLQNPPVISWPARYAATGYSVRLVDPVGSVATFEQKGNWLNLKSRLVTNGAYRWQVRALGAGNVPMTDWSAERSFSVSVDAGTFLVPDAVSLWNKASQIPHPRAFPHGAELDSLRAEFGSSRAADIAQLKARLQKIMGATLIVEPISAFSAIAEPKTRQDAVNALRNSLNYEQEYVLVLGLLWRIEQDRKWLNEAKRRVLNLAAWNPVGSSGVASHNQATRTILLTLAVGYDWFYDEWTSAERAVLLQSINRRYADLYAAIIANGALTNNPYSSWGSYTLGYLVAVAPMIAGDLPQSKGWFVGGFGLYAATFPPWSGEDGGYANGTSYGLWDVPESIVLWDFLRWSTGFDFYKKPAVANFGAFMAYFLPPGAPEGVFGDGAEIRMASSVTKYGKALANRISSPLAAWYARQLFGEDRASFLMLMSPPRGDVASIPDNTPNGVLFPSIGWAALHSNLADRSRFSVYFKSSSFGSYNHSHADQNSFVVHSQGQVLAMDSGVYDYYNSPHWRDWYKQTRAHNAITYDGGIGQSLGGDGVGSKAENGRIVSFASTKDYDLVVGDATTAYGGVLSAARRWLVLLRPDTLVVVDYLTSAKTRSWEWNFHTIERLENNNGLAEVGKKQKFCVRIFSPDDLKYSVSEGYQPAPSTASSGKHFLTRYSYVSPTKDGVFMAVISQNCKVVPSSVTWKDKKSEMIIYGKRLIFSGTDLKIY